ncbi:hypothetical protein [Methylopila sp. 73B]|uniref:hypothetical protein n=1 Tax=Methylopila sp. 73B TaxID=1120792 RepID=UPI000379BB47|nr:hypothetical protein [Methylopila sp. 73B]
MPTFALKAIAEIASKTIYMLLALFIIGGSSRVAEYFEIKPVQDALKVVDGVLIQERATVIAQGPTFVTSDTTVTTSATAAE